MTTNKKKRRGSVKWSAVFILLCIGCIIVSIILIGRVSKKIAEDKLPSYYKEIPFYYKEPVDEGTMSEDQTSYLEQKISEIPQGDSFIFITDTHWSGNAKHSTQLISYVREHTGIQKVLFGGDILGKASSKEAFIQKGGEYLLESRDAFGSDYIPCVGDHDNNTVNVPNLSTCYVPYQEMSPLFIGDLEECEEYHYYDASDRLANYCSGEEYEEMIAFFKTVYYIDDKKNNIRYIVLNCGNGGKFGAPYTVFGGGSSLLRLQFDWLAETLMSTPTGMNVCVLSHKGAYDSSASRVLVGMLTQFKRKNPSWAPKPATAKNENVESWWPHNSSYDFSSAPDIGLLFTLNGHIHRDKILWTGYDDDNNFNRGVMYDEGRILDQTEKGQIPHIFTATDSVNIAHEVLNMHKGTVSEQCFDVVTIVEDGIVLTRFGAGENRKINVEW